MYGMKQNNSIKKHRWNINILEGGFGERKRTLVARAWDKNKYNRQNVYLIIHMKSMVATKEFQKYKVKKRKE